MSDGRGIPRREALRRMGVAGAGALGAGAGLPGPLLERFLDLLAAGPWQPRFFTAAELASVRVLADTVIPADARSGSATDAGTVEYVDFVLSVSDEERQAEWREGLAWLDAECSRRHAALGLPDPAPPGFPEASAGLRAKILNDVAWPDGARDDLEARVEWFTDVRDLVGSGFFSSRMGVGDLGYEGAYMRPGWEGAPPEALEELGLSYDAWDDRYGDGS